MRLGLLLLSAGQLLFGQSAELAGLVKDPSGLVIADVLLEFRNQDTGVRQQTKTTGDGFYSFPSLKPGTYQATVQAQGFRTLMRPIVLNVADRVSLDFFPQLASVGEQVTVTGPMPQLPIR